MVQGKWFPMGSDLSEAIAIRHTVFQRERDNLDQMSQSVLVYNDETIPVGTGRIFWQEGAFWLSDIGVLPDYRGQGFGDLLIRLLLFKALTHCANEICLRSPKETVAFFEKYGFCSDDYGVMRIKGNDVHLSHCGGHCDGCDAGRKG